jgi:adhesin transport system outer membrane protein
MKSAYFAIAGLILAGGPLAAEPYSINDALKQAVQTNPGVGEASANRRATESEPADVKHRCRNAARRTRVDDKAPAGQLGSPPWSGNCRRPRPSPPTTRNTSRQGLLIDL